MAGLIEDNRQKNDPRSGYNLRLPAPNVVLTQQQQQQEQPINITDIASDVVPANTPLVQPNIQQNGLPHPEDLNQQMLADVQQEVDWTLSNVVGLPVTQFADFKATDGLMHVMELQPYNKKKVDIYVPPGMPEDPQLAAKRAELKARGFNTDPTGNVTHVSGGLGSKASEGWQIGDVVNNVMAIPSFLNKAGVFKFDPNAPGNILGFTLGALGKGIAQRDLGKGFQEEFKVDQFNQAERSFLQALQPTEHGTNLFQGTFGDYGTGVVGGINYALDNLLGGNAIRGVLADLKQNQERARQGKAPEWNGFANALRGKSYSFVDPNSPLNVTGTDKSGLDFWSRFGGGLLLDTLTDINPLNALRRLGVSSLSKAAKRSAQTAAVQGSRGAIMRQLAQEAIQGLDNPLLDIVGKRLLKGKTDDTLLETQTKVRGLLANPKKKNNTVNKTPLLAPPRRIQPDDLVEDVVVKRLDENGKLMFDKPPPAKKTTTTTTTVNPLALPPAKQTTTPVVTRVDAAVDTAKMADNVAVDAAVDTAKRADNVAVDAPPNPMLLKLREIAEETKKPTGLLSTENAKLLADPAAAPTLLESAVASNTIRVKERGVIVRASEEIEEAQRELIRLRIEQNSLKEASNFDLRADLQKRFADLQEDIDNKRKIISGGRELRTDFGLTEELLDAALPTIPLETFVPATNPSLLYQQLKNLSSGQRVYTNIVEYVERSNAQLTDLARFLGHYDGPTTLNSEQLAELRYTYGSIYSPVGHPLDSKAIKQYLQTGVARIETKKGNKVAGVPQETQLLNRMPDNVFPEQNTLNIEKYNRTKKLEDELNNLYEQTNKLDPDVDNEKLLEIDGRIDDIESELNRIYLAETVGSKEYKQFEHVLPDNKKPATQQAKEAAQGLYQAERSVDETMQHVRVLSEELEAVQLMVQEDMLKLQQLPKLEAQQLDVGSHHRLLNERVLNARKKKPTTTTPDNIVFPLSQDVRARTWFNGTKFDVEALSATDPALTNPTRNTLGLGHYFYSDPDVATDAAKAAIPDNVPYSDLPVTETGFVREVAPAVRNTLNVNMPLTKELRDVFVEAAKEAGFDNATLRSYKARLSSKNNRVTTAEAWNKLSAAFAKNNKDVMPPEDIFRQFELNVQAKLEDLGIDSLIFKNNDGLDTLVVFNNNFEELSVIPVGGTGDPIEQALSAVNMANVHNSFVAADDIVGKTNALNARIRFGMELQNKLGEMLETATERADAALSRLIEAEETIEAIVKTDKENTLLRKLQDGAREFAAEIEEKFIKKTNNDEFPGCL